MSGVRRAVGVLLGAIAAFTPAAGASAQSKVPVILYDAQLFPYTAWGSADSSGSVIVFDGDAPRPAPTDKSGIGRADAEVLPPQKAAPLAPPPGPVPARAP